MSNKIFSGTIAALGLATSLLLASNALAADIEAMPAPAAHPVDTSEYQLRGAYAGVSIGYGMIEDFDPHFPTGPTRAEGEDLIVGIHAGYSKRIGQYSLGAEIAATEMNVEFEDLPVSIVVERSIKAKARAGIHIDRMHLYGLVGIDYITTNVGLDDHGLLVGAGVEYAFTDHIIAGIEYNHSSFKDFDGTAIEASTDVVTARLSYHF